jgi:hypothetical protein
LHNQVSKSFTRWIYSRLHVFYWTVLYVTLFVVMFAIGVLPDWTVDEFLEYIELFVLWVLRRLVSLIYSICILVGFYLAYRFRERVLVAAGMDHITMFRWNIADPFGLRSKSRPIEIFIWKVEGAQSSLGKVAKPNDIFIECHLGENEPMRTRVHNNAGQGCIFKESVQLNIDEGRPASILTLLIKDQTLLTSAELGRLVLSTAEVCGIEDQTGKRKTNFTYSTEHFVPLSLNPQGTIWLAVAPVDDCNDPEGARLLDGDEFGLC